MNNEIKLDAAIKLADTLEKNVAFLKERIEIQNQPDFTRWITPHVQCRTYNEFDVQTEEWKLKKVNELIERLRDE